MGAIGPTHEVPAMTEELGISDYEVYSFGLMPETDMRMLGSSLFISPFLLNSILCLLGNIAVVLLEPLSLGRSTPNVGA